MPRRGRPPTYREIVLDLQDDGKLDWYRTFVLWEKTSIGGEKIRGRCYEKVIAEELGGSWGEYDLQYVYATAKEVFKEVLANGKHEKI